MESRHCPGCWRWKWTQYFKSLQLKEKEIDWKGPYPHECQAYPLLLLPALSLTKTSLCLWIDIKIPEEYKGRWWRWFCRSLYLCLPKMLCYFIGPQLNRLIKIYLNNVKYISWNLKNLTCFVYFLFFYYRNQNLTVLFKRLLVLSPWMRSLVVTVHGGYKSHDWTTKPPPLSLSVLPHPPPPSIPLPIPHCLVWTVGH